MVPSFGALNGWIDSNTTQICLLKKISSSMMYSNTTLVKVKSETANGNVVVTTQFKYNSC